MAVFNEERFLAQALDSVFAQGYSELEVIVSDDGSTDATARIAGDYAARYPDRVRVVRGERNQGKAFALNRALDRYRGELIAWLDGDDVMLPGKLERQVQALERAPEAVGCVHDAEMFDADADQALGRFSELVNGGPLRSGGVELWFDPTYRMLPSATMIRSSARPAHGFDERLWFAHDWLFDIEVFRSGRCVALDEVLVRYRRHGANLTKEAARRGIVFEEALMAMAVVEARYPELAGKVKGMRTALLMGEARRHASERAWTTAARYGAAALVDGGLGGGARVARHVVAARVHAQDSDRH